MKTKKPVYIEFTKKELDELKEGTREFRRSFKFKMIGDESKKKIGNRFIVR